MYYIILDILLITSTAYVVNSQRSWCDIQVEDEGWFRCENRKDPYCISHYFRCDGTQHCSDNSDEENCADNAHEAPHRDARTYCNGCTGLQEAILEHHNKLRAKEPASNMNELQWTRAAERKATEHANLCRLPAWGESVHGNMDPDFSQNVARMYTSQQIPDGTVLYFIDKWYEEKEYYNYDDDSCSGTCGHYTVLTTAYARDIGCGLVHCDRTHPETGKTKAFWNFVCNYRKGYNWMVWTTHPSQPYIKGDHCNKCQPGLKCRNNLCA